MATKQILELIAAGASLTDILTTLCDAIDRQNPDMMSMVSLMDPDGQRLWPAAAPRVPAEFVEAISPLLIGENMSSCGTAAFRKERVIIADVAGDPLRSGLGEGRRRELPLKHGLRATWSQPLLSKDDEVLGTFGMFHPTPRSPTERELRLIEDAATLAVIAVEGERAQAALRKAFHEIETSEQELRGVVDAISQIIVVLGADGAGLYANRPLLEYTGLTWEQVMTPDARGNPVLYHSEDWARLQDERRAGLSRAMPFELEWRVRRHDGAFRWFLVRYHPLRDEEGRILRWYASGTDIDDRKRAEERLRNENLALREEIDRSSMFEEIVGSSPALKGVLAQVARVATTDSTVLILGETGTGKELVARAIHRRSASLEQSLRRGQLRGDPADAHRVRALRARKRRLHGRGAATARPVRSGRRRHHLPGRDRRASAANSRSKLLRVLQEREIERVGGSQPIHVDVRVLAATNSDLGAAVARADVPRGSLLPPQRRSDPRSRRCGTGAEDIPLLVEYLVERYARSAGKSIRHISRDTMELLRAYDWPGNVRELQNVIERAVVLCAGDTFTIEESWLKNGPRHPSRPMGIQVTTLAEGEKALIEAALAESHGRVSGPGGAAAKLGIPRQTLESKIKALQIDKLSYRRR